MHDIIVIGGGPAGMMAAGKAAESGARVLLIEKNSSPGKKLLLTGNGRCNLTNSRHDLHGLVKAYGPGGKFLYNALSRFGVEDTVRFFESRGLKTATEDRGRVLPASGRASDVLALLMEYMSETGVSVKTGVGVEGFKHEGGRITGVQSGSDIFSGRSYILCTGGKSYPKTGSTGEAFGWLETLGHTVTPLYPVIAPLTVREGWVKEIEGASLRGVIVSAYASGRKLASVTGDAVVTSNGLSGPTALDISRFLGGVSPDEVTIRIDLMPKSDMDGLGRDIIDLISFTPNRKAKNFVAELLTPKLADTILMLAGIEGDSQLNAITKKQRMALCWQIKVLTLTLKGVAGFDRAMLTKGGVSLREIEPKTMRSKVIDNLYFAGEVMDLDGPTGGYNLQVCWSTGYVAGMSAAEEF